LNFALSQLDYPAVEMHPVRRHRQFLRPVSIIAGKNAPEYALGLPYLPKT